MVDRRSFLRDLVTLPLVGGGVTLIGAPSAPVPLVQAAALPALADPRQRARYAWAAFASAMREVAAGADGWCVLGAADRWTPLPGVHRRASSFLRVAAVHYVDERRPGADRPFLVERHQEIGLDAAEQEFIDTRGWA